MSRPNGKKLSPAEHEEAAFRAYELSVKGWKNPEIAEELGVSRTTVSTLLKEEREKRRREYPDPRPDALAHYSAIAREAWRLLGQIRNPTSYTNPALLNIATNAQHRQDAINGVEAPKKSKLEYRNLDLSKISGEELDEYERIVSRIVAQAEGD